MKRVVRGVLVVVWYVILVLLLVGLLLMVLQSGDKQSAVNSAAEMALKMYMKNQGGSGGSGASGLMSLASKFL